MTAELSVPASQYIRLSIRSLDFYALPGGRCVGAGRAPSLRTRIGSNGAPGHNYVGFVHVPRSQARHAAARAGGRRSLNFSCRSASSSTVTCTPSKRGSSEKSVASRCARGGSRATPLPVVERRGAGDDDEQAGKTARVDLVEKLAQGVEGLIADVAAGTLQRLDLVEDEQQSGVPGVAQGRLAGPAGSRAPRSGKGAPRTPAARFAAAATCGCPPSQASTKSASGRHRPASGAGSPAAPLRRPGRSATRPRAASRAASRPLLERLVACVPTVRRSGQRPRRPPSRGRWRSAPTYTTRMP